MMSLRSHTVRGGALSLTLAIAIVITASLSAFILAAYFYRLEDITRDKKKSLLRSLESTIQLALAENQIPYNERKDIALFEEQTDSVILFKEKWGCWDLYSIEVSNVSGELTRVLTKGKIPSAKGKSALFLYDDKRPLSVAGDTRISGVAYLPFSGIQSAYVNRIGYSNDSLYYGTKMESEGKMPVLNDSLLTKLGQYLEPDTLPFRFSKIIEYNKGTVRNSFQNDTVWIIQGDEIILRDSIIGKVWVNAGETLVIESEAYLENVVLSAPWIEIEENFVGNLQAISTDTILVQKNVQLSYPSLLAVLNSDPPGHINIEIGSRIEGTIIVDGKLEEHQQRILTVKDEAVINGMVYCNGLFELEGAVHGHVTTRKFMVNTLTALYENYLFNAELDGRKLFPHYLAPDLWFVSEESKVLQWLD